MVSVASGLLHYRPLLQSSDRTVVVATIDGFPAAVFGLVDTLRPEASQVVSELRRMGLEVGNLSGCGEYVVSFNFSQVSLAEMLRIFEVIALEFPGFCSNVFTVALAHNPRSFWGQGYAPPPPPPRKELFAQY